MKIKVETIEREISDDQLRRLISMAELQLTKLMRDEGQAFPRLDRELLILVQNLRDDLALKSLRLQRAKEQATKELAADQQKRSTEARAWWPMSKRKALK